MSLKHCETSANTHDMSTIAFWAGLGMGGTQKAAALYAVGLKRRGYSVDYLSTENGAHSKTLEAAGVSVIHVHEDFSTLRRYLESDKPDVVIPFVSGHRESNPLFEMIESMDQQRPRVIEMNIFGWMEDPRAESLADYRCFISRASGVQAFRRAGRNYEKNDHGRFCAVYFPVEEIPELTIEEKRLFRNDLGVGENEILIVRLGRPKSSKWKDWELDAFLQANPKACHLKLLLMEARDNVRRKAENCLHADRVILPRATDDVTWINKLYAASNLTLHASTWGESFGYTIAEAMSAGHPCIVRTTPWGDNAQVELVENGVTGFVCASVPEMSRRLRDLVYDPDLRRRMGQAGKARISTMADPEKMITLLEAIIRKVIHQQPEHLVDQAEEEFARYFETFDSREWKTSEGCWPHFIDHVGSRVYSAYRTYRYR